MRILGIDDNQEINEMLMDVLTPLSYEYRYVNNGKDGLNLIQEQNWNVVLLDLAMPKFSGIDVIQELVKNGNMQKQPIIVFTASSVTDSEMEDLLKLGVKTCLKKPVNLDLLVRTLEEHATRDSKSHLEGIFYLLNLQNNKGTK